MNRYLAMGIVALAAILWGFIGLCTRAMYDCGLDSIQINGVRGILCAFIFLMIIVLSDPKSLVIKKRKDILKMIFYGVLKFLMDIFYIQSLMEVSLALAGILLATETYFMLFISLFLFRGGITPAKVLATFVGFSGVALLMNIFTNPGEINVEGVLYGLGAGLFSALYSTGVKLSLNDGYKPNTVLFYVFLVGAVLFMFVMDVPATFSIAFGTPNMIFDSLILTFLLTLVPYYLYAKGMESLDPITVLILALLEAVTSAVVGVMIFSEPMDAFNVLGIAMVLGSILLMNINLARYSRRRKAH